MPTKAKETALDVPNSTRRRSRAAVTRPLLLALCVAGSTLTLYACYFYFTSLSHDAPVRVHRAPLHAKEILHQCAGLRATPGPPVDFLARDISDRFEPGTPPTLIRNAHIWTGARNGTETVKGDVLLSGGVVKGIGYVPQNLLDSLTDLVTVEADGAWLTPGLGTPSLAVFVVLLTRMYSRLAFTYRTRKCTDPWRCIRRGVTKWSNFTVAEKYRWIQHT